MALLDQYFGFGKSLPSFDDALAAGQPPVDEAAASEEVRTLAAERMKRGAKRAIPQLPDWGEGSQVTAPTSQIGMLNSGSLGINARTALTPNMGDPSGAGEPPTANDPMASEPQVFKDGVPVPKPRPIIPSDPTSNVPDRAPITDASSSNAQAPLSIAPGPQQPQQQGGGISGMLGNLLKQENAPLLLSLAGGFAGAPSFGTGMRRAFSGAAPAAMQLQQMQQKNTSQASLYKSLMDRGVPPAEALAAATDPNMLKIIGAKYFETKPRVPHKIGTDMMGNDIMGSFDPNTSKYYDAANREIGSGGSGASIPDSGAGMLAKDVKEINQELPAQEYKAQFSPQVQAQIDNYISGDTMPTGNPRIKGSAAKIKEWAQLYGSKAGIPVSDAAFTERRTYRNQLGSEAAGTAGGMRKAFYQSVDHADSLATQLEKLNNYDPIGIAPVGRAINSMRELSSTQAGIAKEAQRLGQTLAGEVGKLFSGSAGGGVHERDLTRQAFATVNTPKEMAGALRGTIETMEGGLHALEQSRDQKLGPNSNVHFMTPEVAKKIARIREVADRLENGTAPPAAPPSGKTGSGINWSVVQ